MDLLHAIKTRRSARTYGDEKVPAEIIVNILEQAAAAPSACNERGWKFILVENRDDLDRLYKSGGSSVLKSARQALVVCYKRETDNSEWHDNIQSAAAIIAYFQLLAHAMGIGSCWLCHLPPKRELSAYFSIPSSHTPVAVVAFGYYTKAYDEREKAEKVSGRILAMDRWDFDTRDEDNKKISFLLRKIFRSIYYKIPFRGSLRGISGRYEKKFDD